MFIEVVTTVTSKIELSDAEDGSPFKSIEHSIMIEAGEFGAALGERATMMLVRGALGAASNTVQQAIDGKVKPEEVEDES